MSREEHAQRMRELNMKRGLIRAPRRGWSMTEYQGDASNPTPPHIKPNPFEHQPSIPEHAVLPEPVPSKPATPVAETPEPTLTQQLPRRPKLPPPRRSYSVMDYEPPRPGQPKPSHRLGLLDLPSELHYSLLDHLDPIDSVCLALAHPSLYAIHRRAHPTPVPLSARYSGPNDMEWAWRGAGSLRRAQTFDSNTDSASQLGHMRVKGQVYCRKCGVNRCELHRHLKEWMGAGREYCEIREAYGPKPGDDAKQYCFMSSPKNPRRCGRHGGK